LQYAQCQLQKTRRVDDKVMKTVPNCTKFELNEAIDNTKAKVDTKLIELELKCAKSKFILAIGNATVKLDIKLK
jgi:hypothetical protein